MDVEKAQQLLGDNADSGTAKTFSKLFPDICDYTREDFLNSEKPYEFIYMLKDNKFKQKRLLAAMTEQAKKCKVTNFPTLYKAYADSQPDVADDVGNYTSFPNQPEPLPCGKWICDVSGVRTQGEKGSVLWACPHPIMPVARYTNIDTGEEKLKLAFFKGKFWRELVIDRMTVSVSNKITELAKHGIVVTSETARNLVNYLYDVEQAAGDLLPETECVTHLGWIERGEDTEFAPYTDGVVFDGETCYKAKYESVKLQGSAEDGERWLNFIASNIRKNNVVARMVFAASVASVLVKPFHCNTFWLHLWGTSGTAKTVLMMCAASIWGDPTLGKFVSTFDATGVGMEKTASFLNSMPYFIDELQIVRSREDMDTTIYKLTENCGRTRGNKQGGIDYTSSWANCIVSTGERPINTRKSGGGAVNRVIEIECKEQFFKSDEHPDLWQPRDVVSLVKSTYGLMGKMVVLALTREESDGRPYIQHLEDVFSEFYRELTDRHDRAEKQAQAGALILAADHLISEIIGGDELTAEEIAPYLKTADEVDVNPRAYEYLCEVITQNQTKFGISEKTNEIWGEFCGDESVFIIKAKFEQICLDAGYNSSSLLSWLSDRQLIRRTDSKHMSVLKRIGNVPVRCIHLKLMDENADECEDEADFYYPDL